jgi:carbonic anhydrase
LNKRQAFGYLFAMSIIPSLLSGFEAFQKSYFGAETDLMARLARQGQEPQMLVIACSDSRVDPALLFGVEPGDLFMVRVVANLVPPYDPHAPLPAVSAAIEYAVRDLNVPEIMVMGHAQCGGIGGLCADLAGNDLADRDFLKPWITTARAAVAGEMENPDKDSLARRAEQAALRHSLRNLRGFPWIAERLAAQRLRLHGWWFDLDEGAIWAYDDDQDIFKHLAGPEPRPAAGWSG